LGTALLFGPPLVNRKIAQIAPPRSRRSVVVVAARTSENSGRAKFAEFLFYEVRE
jgi:hypothetical protein